MDPETAVFQSPAWPLDYVVGWLAFRDPLLAFAWEHFQPKARQKEIAFAWRTLHAALIDDTIAATGVSAQDGARRVIGALEWVDLTWGADAVRVEIDDAFGAIGAPASAAPNTYGADVFGAVDYSMVTLSRKEVLALWPAPVLRRGQGGRPAKVAPVLAEAARRIAAGEAHEALGDEAGALDRWAEANLAPELRPGLKTIQNRLPPFRRDLNNKK